MILGVSMGDAGGVGPEILLRAFRAGQIRCPLIVFGDLAILEHCNRLLACGVPLRKAAGAADCREGFLNVVDLGLLGVDALRIGEVDAAAGAAAREYIVAATRTALRGETGAVVTLPVNKEAIALSDAGFTGHTELIASLCGVEQATLMLVSGSLIVSHVSTHVSLREALERVRKDRIAQVIEATAKAVGKLRARPRIAVAGLNPHAGEHGLFGREEIEEIGPAVEWAKSQGLAVEGPFPPDTVFYLAVERKRFDAVVCMYHDQGHIPMKLLDFEGAVNVSLGLPIVRTSVDHGTAFDIAWKGVASTKSFVAALKLAAKLAV
jgi:4-hydroxythreonine-4-phosphate dehydrogenase